jgi:periplasmic protein TonB
MFSRRQLWLCTLVTCGLLITFDAKIFAVDAGDAGAYLDQVESRIMAVWKLPEKLDGKKVIVRMRLERSGRVSNVRVEKSSGDKKFDASAIEAVRRAMPFPPVPESAKVIVGDLHMVLDPTVPDQRVGKTTENAFKSKPAPFVPR